MQVDLIENALLSAAVNPWLKALISRFDIEYPEDARALHRGALAKPTM